MEINIEDIKTVVFKMNDTIGGEYVCTYTRLNDNYFKIEYSGYPKICKFCGEIKSDGDEKCNNCSEEFSIITEEELIDAIGDLFDDENVLYINGEFIKDTRC